MPALFTWLPAYPPAFACPPAVCGSAAAGCALGLTTSCPFLPPSPSCGFPSIVPPLPAAPASGGGWRGAKLRGRPVAAAAPAAGLQPPAAGQGGRGGLQATRRAACRGACQRGSGGMHVCSHAASQPLYCPAPAGRRAQSILQPALVCQQHSHPIPHDAPIVPLSSLPASQLQLAAAKRLSAARRASLAEALRPSRLTICATCKDVPEDPVVSICGHVYCSQCVGSEISKAGRGSAGERPRCEGAAGWAGWACPSSGVMKRHIEAHKCILSFPLVSPSSACLPDRARFDQLQKLSWHSTASLVTIRWASTTP